MLNNSHKMPNNTRSIAKMSLNSAQPTTIVCECLTAPRNELYIIFDLHNSHANLVSRIKSPKKTFMS